MGGLGLDYIISHTGIWFNIFVLLAIIALAAVIIYFIFRRRKYIKMEEELEDLLQEKYEREGTDVNTMTAAQPMESSAAQSGQDFSEYR